MMQTKNQIGNSLSKPVAALAVAGLSVLSLCLEGCAVVGGAGPTTKVLPNGPHITGTVHGGYQPVSASNIQLYAVGTGGNKTAASPLLSPAVQTTGGGAFNISGSYTCPANSLVYITATQGNPGSGSNNSAIGLMATLGSCATLQQNAATTTINIDEVTTVGAVYALSSFIADFPAVGYASSNLSGITNAFATANVLVNTTNGNAPGGAPVSGVTLPTIEIYTLADAISTCIDSTGPSSPGCTTLFGAATPSGGSAPTNTIAALANIAHSPATNVGAVFGLVNATSPFQPALAAAPSDWTMSIYYQGGGLALPNGVAIDSLGNAWVANEGGNAVTELATGSFVSGTSGYASSSMVGPQGIAVDASNNVWLANTGADSVLELTPSGKVSATLRAGISGPVSVAVDGNGGIWVANFDGSSVAKFSGGSPAAGSPFTNAAISAPTGLAIDASNNVWVANSSGDSITLLNNSGVYQNSFTDGLMIAPGGVATDSVHGRVWTAATGINAISGLTSTGGPVAGRPLAAGGISIPLTVAVDGSGTVWTVSNLTTGSVAAYTSAGVAKTPSTGFGLLNTPVGLALDASGNLWTTDAGDNSVTQFIGLAAPTVTPLVSSAR